MDAKDLVRFDWAMKRLLRNKASFVILEGFLSELFHEDVSIDSLLESEGNAEDETDKFNRVDLLARNAKGELIIVEIQNNHEIDYFQRMLYGASKVVTDHMSLGQPYQEVRKVYSVNIVYFDLGQGEDYIYHGRTAFTGIHHGDELNLSIRQRDLFAKARASDIFPEYYVIKVNQFNEIAKDSLDDWIYYFKTGGIREGSTGKGLEEVRRQMDIRLLDPAARGTYKRYVESLSHAASVLFTARDEGWAEGLAAGKAAGKAEGIEKGIEKGIEEGARRKALEIARKLRAAGQNDETILTITGLEAMDLASLA